MDTEVNIEKLETHPKWAWLVKPCERYKEELSDCRDFRAKFHQYFIHGETGDCSQWKTDYTNCMKFREVNDEKALHEVIESEKARRLERLQGHFQNDIWEKRESPPDDWNKPLPKEFIREDAMSYLSIKARELKEGKIPEDQGSLCTIS